MKKEAVVSVMHAMGDADDALGTYAAAYELNREKPIALGLQHAKDEWYRCINEFGRRRAMALIVCESPTNEAMMEVQRVMKSGVNAIENGEKSYNDLNTELGRAISRAFAMARRELGVKHKRAESKVVTPRSTES